MKNKRIFIAFMALLLLTITNCSAQNTRALIGKWFFEDLWGDMALVEFTQTEMSVSSLEDEDDNETFSYKADNMTIKFEDETIRYNIQNGNVLTLTDGSDVFIGKKLQNNVTVLTGKYELVNDEGVIVMLEFIDRSVVRVHSEFLGMSTKYNYQYKISDNHLFISDSKGSMILDIIGDIIIKGNTLGGLGDDSIFVKK